ncbi:uncharacterized protein LOC134107119 [Pungitius pungitius]|uniref:uncharacterized protein LOC134107119 n=1 Tax=Pungitius pungitius TaxID=134920 RepID=UPI002E103F88
MAERRTVKESHKWTPEETRRLIRFRAENEKDFMKSKTMAKQQWEKFVKEIGLEGKVTGQQASKKWENLKQKYKELRTPKTGSGTDQGEVTVATWQYYGDMHEVLGARPAMDPPVVVASFQPAEDPMTILMDIVEPSTSELSTTAASWTPDTGTSTPAATSATTSRRRSNPIMEFMIEEALQEQRRHEESEAKSQRFLDLFERMIEKM